MGSLNRSDGEHETDPTGSGRRASPRNRIQTGVPCARLSSLVSASVMTMILYYRHVGRTAGKAKTERAAVRGERNSAGGAQASAASQDIVSISALTKLLFN